MAANPLNYWAMEFRGRPILITGGAGFLGSHLCEEMVRQGARVTVYDSTARGKSRIQRLLDDEAIELIEADLLDYEILLEAIKGKTFIWHLAANTDIPAGLSDTSLDLKNNVIVTHNLLEAMRKTGVTKVAFPSSGAIYGEKTSGFRSETQGPTLPISLYGAGKLAGEAFISAYSHLFGIQAWIFRFGNVIGARIGHGCILDFIKKLMANPNELEVLGDGTQTKSYFLVEECIEGMQYVIDHTEPQDNRDFCEVYNLGALDDTPVLEVAKIVIEEMGLKDTQIKIRGGQRGWPGDQAKIALDISKIRTMGWKPKYTSTEAVRIAVRRMLEQKHLYV